MAYGDPLFDREAMRCKQCGFPHEKGVALLVEAEDAIDGVHRDLIGKRSQIKRLEGDNAKDVKRHPRYKEACEVVRYWGKVLEPKARELQAENRVRPTIARLMNGHTIEGLKLCIDGYAKKPYVTKSGRSATGKPNERHVRVDLIFRDADHVQAGIRMAREAKERPVYADWRDVRRTNHATILKALPGAIRDQMMGAYVTICPRCESTLTIFDPAGAPDSLLSCEGCAMNERTFLAALLVGGSAPDPRTLAALEDARHRLDALPV